MSKKIELLTTKELAQELNLREETLCRWRRAGKGPAFVQDGRYIRYPRKSLERFLQPDGEAV